MLKAAAAKYGGGAAARGVYPGGAFIKAAAVMLAAPGAK